VIGAINLVFLLAIVVGGKLPTWKGAWQAKEVA